MRITPLSPWASSSAGPVSAYSRAADRIDSSSTSGIDELEEQAE
ncbi:hypothetical protein NC651_036715 [Populus alba x Populus x berolinensis]|nr:hypothetical protein NC651_036715 [Populus alba x Populus x berolinensis]